MATARKYEEKVQVKNQRSPSSVKPPVRKRTKVDIRLLDQQVKSLTESLPKQEYIDTMRTFLTLQTAARLEMILTLLKGRKLSLLADPVLRKNLRRFIAWAFVRWYLLEPSQRLLSELMDLLTRLGEASTAWLSQD